MTTTAKEYGEGLYELARDEHVLEQVHGEVLELSEILKAEPRFLTLITSRAIEREARVRVVDETFGGRAHTFIVNFMKLLVEKERGDILPDALAYFHQRYNEDMGIVEARVTSAVPLTDNDLEALRQKLHDISKKQVHLLTKVDPSVIGGVRVEMDGRRYDNTIQNKLGRLRQSLTRGL